MFESVQFVAATSDIWSRGNVSFIAVSAHFFHPLTFVLQTKFLACEHFEGRHTALAIATKLKDIFEKFGIQEKVFYITTDSAANYVACMKKFGNNNESNQIGFHTHYGSDDENHEDESDDDDDDSHSQPNLMEFNEDFERNGFVSVPIDCESMIPYMPSINLINCAAHLLDKLGKQPVSIACQRDESFSAKYQTSHRKMEAIWKIRDSRNKAEYFKKEIGLNIIGPHRIRWMATFDAVCLYFSFV